MAVFQINAVPAFIQLLSSPNLKLRDNSAWALGNIAGDCPQLRDHVISQGVLQPFIDILMPAETPINTLRFGTWTLSNMCRGKSPAPNFESVRPGLHPDGGPAAPPRRRGRHAGRGVGAVVRHRRGVGAVARHRRQTPKFRLWSTPASSKGWSSCWVVS